MKHYVLNYIRDVKYFNEEVIDYYLNDYSRTLVRDYWLEDLNDEMRLRKLQV